ncbi:SIMPL domain-containing protein [Marivita sp. GX14005]|uniref:SIMPL domain-containing protein n=1 Tax=Marivita sp. GX14005 TaxID=2942276 RepID=UPI0020189E6B|nr:SIMPL domain-containing protein [Marivita sp. GX14005]MCL3883526.1 SIMPL domain-containing protein [Marivita sp. GX14005]
MSKFLSILTAIALCGAVQMAHAQEQERGRITVTAEGQVSAVPDMAVITLGAQSEAESAAEAMNEASRITAAILDRLASLDVAARDIKTSDLTLDPLWNRPDETGRRRIEGYQASNRVTVRLRETGRLGDVLDAVLQDGANTLGGLQFMLSDLEPLLDEARRKAVSNARARAELYAEAAGVELGRLVSLSESGGQGPRPEMFGMARASDAGVPVAEGETELSAQVTLVFEIDAPSSDP